MDTVVENPDVDSDQSSNEDVHVNSLNDEQNDALDDVNESNAIDERVKNDVHSEDIEGSFKPVMNNNFILPMYFSHMTRTQLAEPTNLKQIKEVKGYIDRILQQQLTTETEDPQTDVKNIMEEKDLKKSKRKNGRFYKFVKRHFLQRKGSSNDVKEINILPEGDENKWARRSGGSAASRSSDETVTSEEDRLEVVHDMAEEDILCV